MLSADVRAWREEVRGNQICGLCRGGSAWGTSQPGCGVCRDVWSLGFAEGWEQKVDMFGNMRLLTAFAPEDGHGSRGCAGGKASMAGVGEQEDRVDRSVTLAVWGEPSGLFSRAPWEMTQGLGDGRGRSDTSW